MTEGKRYATKFDMVQYEFDVCDDSFNNWELNIKVEPMQDWQPVAARELADHYNVNVNCLSMQLTDASTGFYEVEFNGAMGLGYTLCGMTFKRVNWESTEPVQIGGCPKCSAPTKFVRTALVCDSHGVVGGF